MVSVNKQENLLHLANMKQTRSRIALGGISDVLYAVGGRNQDHGLRNVESYFVLSDKWKMQPCLKHHREKPGVCCHGN